MMKKITVFCILFLVGLTFGWTQTVKILKDRDGGWEMTVDGKPFYVKGVVWAVNPPGTSHNFSLWNESDTTIRKVIDMDGELMQQAGINAIRVDSSIPKKWVEYMYTKYGIYSIIHDTLDRWGSSAKGRYHSPTNYYIPEIRENISKRVHNFVNVYKDTSGVLMYILGDGNGDGLYWSGEDSKEVIETYGVDPRFRKANALFSLVEEIMADAKYEDPYHPVGFLTNDLGWIELISDTIRSMDFLACNVNRGMEAGPSFWRDGREKIDRPILIGSIGCDAWNAKTNQEDQYTQAVWITSQWRDMYANAYGKGQANSIGGIVNEWTDQWYKFNYDAVLGDQIYEHTTIPHWSDEGFWYDFTWGEENVTAEWMGITSQGPAKYRDWFRQKLPRAAYFALQHIWSVNPWELSGTSLVARTAASSGDEQATRQPAARPQPTKALDDHFTNLDMGLALTRGLGDSKENIPSWGITNKVSVLGRATGDDVIKTINKKDGNGKDVQGENIFTAFDDHQFGAQLFSTFWGSTEFGTKAKHKLDGGVTLWIRHDDVIGTPVTSKIDRTAEMGLEKRPVDVYQAWFDWQGAGVKSGHGAEISARYHTGKGSWLGEGDFFNLNAEQYDLWSSDIWDIKAPISIEGRYNFGLKDRQGLAIIAGPKIYSGAAPQILGKWYQELAIKDHDFAYSVMAGQSFSSLNDELGEYDEEGRYTIPNTVASAWFTWKPWLGFGPFMQLQAGIMESGAQKIGRPYYLRTKWNAAGEAEPIEEGRINFVDTLSAKLNYVYQPISYFAFQAEAIYAGLVADTNWVPMTMSSIFADIGTGNRIEGKVGLTGAYGNFRLTLNALYRQPLKGPVESEYMPSSITQDGNYQEIRNASTGKITTYRSNPFSVGGNREMFSLEAIIAFDLEPASWIWEWNVWDTESGKVATRVRGRYNIMEGPSDPGYRKGADGKRRYDYTGYPGTEGNALYPDGIDGNYELGWMIFWNPMTDLRIGNSLEFVRGYPYNGIPNGVSADRLTPHGFSDTLKLRYRRLICGSMIAYNLWGPVSSDRENNQTYPLRWALDLAFGLVPRPSLMNTDNRVGVRWGGIIRDRYSPNHSDGRDYQELDIYFNYTF